MIYIKKGSIFDEKCDLVVLPCSSSVTVTTWVRSEIEKYRLPFPKVKIPYGKAHILESGTAYKKANYIAYAASVDHRSVKSSLDKIESILSSLISYSTENDITLINIPVLGTGAGGLEHSEVLAIYRKAFETSRITLNVYIPDSNIAELFIEKDTNYQVKNSSKLDNPRVFISYSWGDQDIQNWSLDLARKLCANGVNARIDKFHLQAGFDMPQWMTDEIFKADKVLLVCDSNYADKANMKKAGVGWETMIVQGDMLLQGMTSKYIAIAYGDFDKNIPIYMKSKLAMTKEEVDKKLDDLLVHLFEIDVAPEIGEIPDWIRTKIVNRANAT